jgi:hypothetical protein
MESAGRRILVTWWTLVLLAAALGVVTVVF